MSDPTNCVDLCHAAPSTLKVLHVIAPGAYGGLERVVHSLTSGLQSRGHDVLVAAICDEGRPLPESVRSLDEAGVRVSPLMVGDHEYVREWRLVRNIISKFGPDVVHTHGYRCDVIAGAAARRCGVPTITTAHGFSGGSWKNRLYEQIQMLAIRRVDAAIGVSRQVVARLVAAGVHSARIQTIPNALDASNELLDREQARELIGVPQETYLIGWVGRLTEVKGPDIFLEALRELPGQDWHAVILGDGPMRDELVRQAERHDIADRLTWTGAVRDPVRLFRAFDAFALTSRSEGTPIALLEAMHASVPIVAAAVGGVPDVITASEGILVAPGDSEAFSQAFRSIQVGQHAARARAEAARIRLNEGFGLSSWLQRHEALYHSVRESNLSQGR